MERVGVLVYVAGLSIFSPNIHTCTGPHRDEAVLVLVVYLRYRYMEHMAYKI